MAIRRFSTSTIVNNLLRYAKFWDQTSTYSPAPTNSYFPIASYTVPSGGLSLITFANIPQTFSHLEVRMMVRNTTSADDLKVNFNNDAGSNYSYHSIYTYLATLSYLRSASSTAMLTVANGSGPAPATNVFCAQILKINDYTSTSKNKVMTFTGGYSTDGSGSNINYEGYGVGSGMWYPTTPVAITSISFDPASNRDFAQYSNISLYGVN
jgi:hypothetical protein